LERASKYYQYQLRKHENGKSAVDYLKERGVSGEIARDFGIGYAPPGWDNLLKAIGVTNAEQSALLKAGMVIQKERRTTEGKEAGTSAKTGPQYYDRFRHRIVFPIRDSRGRTIAFGGRVLGDDKPKYLNSPETPVFHKGSELYGLYESRKSGQKSSRLLLVEGYMDVIALAQCGIRNAVATLGTATSTRHLIRMFRLVSEIVFCFDGDAAGRTAAWRALEATLPLMEDGRQVKFLFLPEGEDPDTLVRKIGNEDFNSRIEKATPLEDFFFDKLSIDLDTHSIEGKARLSNLAKPLIKQFPHGVYAQLMLDRLSTSLGVSSESLNKLMEKKPEESSPPTLDHIQDISSYYPRPSNNYAKKTSSNTGSASQIGSYRKSASLKAIELLIGNPEIALQIKQDLAPLRSAEDESRKLLLSLIELVQQSPDIETFTLLGYCYGTSLGSQLTQLLKSEKITPTEGVEEEFLQILDSILSDITKKLKLLQLKNQLKSRVDALNPSKDQS